jgi:signal transduction histidine kinase
MTFLANLDGSHLSLFLVGIFGMLGLSIALVAFIVIYQRRIFAQERLRQDEEKAHQKQLLTAAVDVQESERRRIASDLHDDIGSLLSATRLYLRQLNPAATAERIDGIRNQSLTILDEMIQNTRRITHDLLPPTLAKFGFHAAAEDLCERIDHSGAIKVYFTTNTEDRFDPKGEIALYRVLQELLNNTIKHAGAKTVRIEMDGGREALHLFYQDDGKGFDLATTKSKGLGLRNIESRVTLVGGSIRSDSAPGAGLKVTIVLPLVDKPLAQ